MNYRWQLQNALTCQIEVLQWSLRSHCGVEFRVEAGDAVIRSVDFPFRCSDVMCVRDGGSSINELNLHTHTQTKTGTWIYTFLSNQGICLGFSLQYHCLHLFRNVKYEWRVTKHLVERDSPDLSLLRSIHYWTRLTNPLMDLQTSASIRRVKAFCSSDLKSHLAFFFCGSTIRKKPFNLIQFGLREVLIKEEIWVQRT